MKIFFLLALPLAACSSTMDMPMPADGGHDMDAMEDMGTMDSGTSDASPTETGAPAAPTITAVNKMMGALHVQWTNNIASCESIEGERKSDADPYKVVFTVPGTVGNKMDMEATKDMTYTYRLRCKMGATYSSYSNELGQNPVK